MNNLESLEYFNQSKYFVGAEKFEDALNSINKAIETDKMNIEFYIQKGIILANLDSFDLAIIEFGNALKLDKKNGEAYFHIGNIKVMQNLMNEGIENYNKAIAYGYDDAQIYFNLALMYEELDNDELALRNYSKVIIKDPLRVDARVRKAQIFIQNEKYPEALETLNELILADPDLFEGYHLKALLLAEMGDLNSAMKVLDEACTLFPKDAAFALDKVNICVMMNEIEMAKDLVSAIEKDYELSLGNKRQLLLEKSRLYALDADINNIILSLTEAKKISMENHPEDIDSESTFLLSNCYLEIKDYDKVIEMSKQLIDYDELQYLIPSLYTLPYAYQQKGETEKADMLFKESISKLRKITLDNPEILDGYFFRALCHKEIKENDKAMELCDYLLKIDENSSMFHSLKAEILFSDGREEEAKAEKELSEKLK